MGRRGSHFAARVAGAIVALFSLTSCISRDYMEVYDLPSDGWSSSSSIVFTYSPDSVSVRDLESRVEDDWIDITVRYSEDFAYVDLPLEVKGVTTEKYFWIDTVYFALGEKSEAGTYQWSGRHFSNHYDITRRYRSGIRYNHPAGEYAISIRQLTEEDTLQGILSVGITASGARVTSVR